MGSCNIKGFCYVDDTVQIADSEYNLQNNSITATEKSKEYGLHVDMKTIKNRMHCNSKVCRGSTMQQCKQIWKKKRLWNSKSAKNYIWKHFTWFLILFNYIWLFERVTKERKNESIVKIAKKGDPTDCNNWRQIRKTFL